MAITFDGLDVETLTQADGSQLIQLPDGTDLNNLGDKMTIKVDGVEVDPASITPNPTTTFITDSEIETFVYDGKAYSFRFTAGEYFTVVIVFGIRHNSTPFWHPFAFVASCVLHGCGKSSFKIMGGGKSVSV